jgi:SNF2 family DNA or RNA helicase
MAIDRQQKKKKKREKRRKDRRMRMERIQRHEKAEMYSSYANEAFFYDDYDEALNFALKSLKFDPTDGYIRDIAIKCAAYLNKQALLYPHLTQAFRQDLFWQREEYLLLADLALGQKDFELAREIFQGLLADTYELERPLTKVQLKKLEKDLNDCNLLERAYKNYALSSHKLNKLFERSPEYTSAQPPPSDVSKGKKPDESLPEIQLEPEISYEIKPQPVITAIEDIRRSTILDLETTLQAYKLSFRTSYDQLICLPTLQNVQSLWYQEDTARKVMKLFRGRAILADEVGLGKTIEAGMILKEYLLRGLVHTVLILTPSNLVNQWHDELLNKFQLSFISSNDPLFRQDANRFWQSPLILASIHTAKTKHHFDSVTARNYDMVIVDEAHHLKNRNTLNWKLVNAIPKTFLLLLTATPVQNNLEELFNLVTLLSPGHLKTRQAFKKEFVTRGNPTDPQNREKLRQLLKEVMVRNTRSVTQVHLPPRFATTVKVAPSRPEEDFYHQISDFITEQSRLRSNGIARLSLQKLLEAAGSSHFAALKMLEHLALQDNNGVSHHAREIIKLGKEIELGAKTQQVIDLLHASPDQKIIFVNYRATLEYLEQILTQQRITHVVYQGTMSAAQKQATIDAFRDGCPVLLSTGTGGEGHNLQFCHTMINYDLPWNPMEIEQRIGRIHRIGQEKEVQVYNFCASGSIEDHILEVLDRKINMFELVVGEIDMILGRMKGEQEFGELVYDIWIKNRDDKKRKDAFNALASRLKRARMAYEKSKELDEKLFQEDFGV